MRQEYSSILREYGKHKGRQPTNDNKIDNIVMVPNFFQNKQKSLNWSVQIYTHIFIYIVEKDNQLFFLKKNKAVIRVKSSIC